MSKGISRISTMATIFLIIGAVIVDIINIFPAVGSITTAIGWFIFNLYFYFAGISVFSGKKLAVNLGAIIIGLIPFLEVLPETTVGIISIIVFVKAEDKLGLKLPLSGKDPLKGALSTKPPILNQ